MAVKKKTASKPKTKAPKSGTKKKSGSTKKASPKKGKASSSKKAPKTKSSSRSAAPKLTDAQKDLLKRVGGASEAGYKFDKKAEQRTLDSLVVKKLVKRGAKDKTDSKHPYSLTNAGKKHLGSESSATSSPSPTASA